MRCKEHITDLSSIAGVCATCLRERLLLVVAAQSQLARAAESTRRKPDPPPLVFPRSVSPYVSRRINESNNGDAWIHHHQRFYSTPQVGPTYGDSIANVGDYQAAIRSFKKKNRTFLLFSNLFRSRSDKFDLDEPSSSSSSPSLFLSIFAIRWKKQQSSRANHVEEFGRLYRGMSPAIEADSGDECDRLPSKISAEASPRWKRTLAAARRARNGSRNNALGLAFCMSPLVRVSPNRHRNQKGGLSCDVSFNDDSRSPMKSQLANAAGFSDSRSRKLADFGTVNYNC